MRGRIPWPFALAALALAVQIVGALAVRSLYHGAFGAPASIGEDTAVRSTYAILLAGGLLSGSLGTVGAYAALRTLRLLAAVPLVIFVYTPIVFAAVTALYGALVLLALV
jgi:hypothetical protein